MINLFMIFFAAIKFKPAQTGPSLAEAKLNLQQSVSAGLNFDVQYPTIEKVKVFL